MTVAAGGSGQRLSVALAQIPCVVGDLAGNVDRIIDALASCNETADILLTPEMSLCGYPPEDLLGYADFLASCENAADDLCRRAGKTAANVHIMFGLPLMDSGKLFNAVRVVCAGSKVADAYKIRLPNYGVFDEKRYFESGSSPQTVSIKGKKVGIAICHDIWHSSFVDQLAGSKLDLLCVANASPFYLDKQAEREAVTADAAQKLGCDIAYVNFAGAQDEHIYDGGTHYRDTQNIVVRLGSAAELASSQTPTLAEIPAQSEQLRSALAAGVGRYVAAAGGGPVFIGISGGIDSAVTACIAVDALGAQKVVGVLMPSQYTASISIEDAKQLAVNLGIRMHEINIDPSVAVLADSLQRAVGESLAGLASENLQARIRGMMLMALANHAGGLVLSTGNKSEMATGFGTIYGDMAGAYAVLKDVVKTKVYDLAEQFNRVRETIPARIISRPPTAELRTEQLDTDTLPPYDVVDAMLAGIVEQLASPKSLVGHVGQAAVDDFVGRLRSSEFKRRQAPIGPTVTKRAFGKDWRMPVSNAYAFDSNGDAV